MACQDYEESIWEKGARRLASLASRFLPKSCRREVAAAFLEVAAALRAAASVLST